MLPTLRPRTVTRQGVRFACELWHGGGACALVARRHELWHDGQALCPRALVVTSQVRCASRLLRLPQLPAAVFSYSEAVVSAGGSENSKRGPNGGCSDSGNITPNFHSRGASATPKPAPPPVPFPSVPPLAPPPDACLAAGRSFAVSFALRCNPNSPIGRVGHSRIVLPMLRLRRPSGSASAASTLAWTCETQASDRAINFWMAIRCFPQFDFLRGGRGVARSVIHPCMHRWDPYRSPLVVHASARAPVRRFRRGTPRY